MGLFDAIANDINSWKNLAYNTGMTFYSSAQSAKQADLAHHRAKELQKIQQDWAEKMSSSAYQRSRKDLEAAGYNPILALGNGGASTPSAGMVGEGASADTSMFGELAKARPFLSKMEKAELDFKTEQTELSRAETQELQSRNQLNLAQKLNVEAMTIRENNHNKAFAQRNAMELDNIASQIRMNNANSALLGSEKQLRQAQKEAELEGINLTKEKQKTERSQQYRNLYGSLGYTTNVNLPFGLGGFSHTGNQSTIPRIYDEKTVRRHFR